ncbi:glutamine--tRNA ligase/YqeY domain fusion protein [Marinihelvus fidelis]|uniref:Glutamine--tRNA ligase n=1 Tax=Marinihelvus fidelis TaxID=2613842 RepID=A0A5N0T522_9GAMM|nr:glutamine--tRNA ligase/YqeY domain fusion protein [Marinihelvus fidelis]KAA9129584.1 glutamine--tRNA ligase/YqeY domain fusion protein [Marinihelvus fidelis]
MEQPTQNTNFIRNIVIDDLDSGKHESIVTRFPPEPNGFLHIGHAKSICLNFGLADEFGGRTHLRFDDTNPLKENEDFAQSIMNDVRWLGFEWDALHHASDYFGQLYEWALHLIDEGLAYVDSQDADTIRAQRGTLTEPGTHSPYRDRPVAENRNLFERMAAGEFADGEHVLRAKIDMAAGNINLRDPVLYRIINAAHHRTGDTWHIYPMYDWAHGQSDSLEHITHSLCTLEFEDHRPLYEWYLKHIPAPSQPRQIEFARGNLNYTVMSKRKLRQLVEEDHVNGWDDPRMPTIAGLRRRGYTPESIRAFWGEMGVSKSESIIDMGVLENAIRNDLNDRAPRAMAVLDPIKVVLLNYPEGEEEFLEAALHPKDESMGTRQVPLSRELWIERHDFMEEPPRKYFRLKPDGEVRLRNAFIIKCVDVIKNDAGEVTELHCEFDPDTRSGMPGANRKVKGTIHWVSAKHAVAAEVRLYDRLFNVPNPLADKDTDFLEHLNPESLTVIDTAWVEPAALEGGGPAYRQFERNGYFTPDDDSTAEKPVFNRTVTLRDTWAKLSR